MENNILQEYKCGASTVCDHKSIPCSPECKIVRQILLDHPLSYALTATADVPAVYLKQFWRTMSKVPGTEDTIKFMLNTQQFTFTVDMFRDTLPLPVETPDTPFFTPANIHTIEAFMNKVGYQGVVDKVSAFFTKNLAQPWQTMFKKKEAIQYPCFIKLIIADLMKKFPNIPKRIKEDYHFIKNDVPLVSVYTTGNVLVQGMLIPDAFLTTEIRETNDFKEYETVFMKEIVDAEKNDVDFKDRLEPGSHKENLKVVAADDDDNAREKKDDEMGSLEIRNEETQTTISTPIRSPRKSLSLDKNIFQELTNTVSIPITTTAKHSQVKKRISSKYSYLLEIAENVVNDLIDYNLKPYSSADLQYQLGDDFHSHHDEHQDDDAPPEGEKRVKMSKKLRRSKSARGSSSKHSRKDSTTYVSKQQIQHQEWDAWEEENVVDEDEVISEDVTLELITKSQNVDKRVPTIFDHARMEATLRDSLSNLSRNAEEYAYHLEQSTSFMENHIKEFRTFNEDARLSIQHWKDSWHKRVYKQNQKKVRKNQEDYYLDYRIIEVVRIVTDQPHGLDFMEQILEMVHDLQLGIESYQIKVNLTAPTLTFPGIEEHAPYTIVDEPQMGLIYLNSKEEKRVMYLEEIVKFCDATLEKVLNEVKLKMFESKFLKKPPLLGELDQDIMKAYKREISKRLSHRQQMRRWESFVNGRPILSTMKRL
ncbi:hypothetical protein Tco_1561620 [Tanacetum coccineum]